MDNKKILVIGELCVDKYQIGICHRIAPDAPVPIFTPTAEHENLGMAGNFNANLISLSSFSTEFIHQKTYIEKIRIVDFNSWHLLLRIDKNDSIPVEEQLDENKFNTILDEKKIYWKDLAAIAVSDYGKGMLTEQFLYTLSQIAKMYNIDVWLDTKKILGDWSKDIIVKINLREYEYNKKQIYNPELYCKALVVTRGANTTLLWEKDRKSEFSVPAISDIIDCSGCGDTFHAALIANYLENKSFKDAIVYANRAASFAATQKGVVVVKKQDIK